MHRLHVQLWELKMGWDWCMPIANGTTGFKPVLWINWHRNTLLENCWPLLTGWTPRTVSKIYPAQPSQVSHKTWSLTDWCQIVFQKACCQKAQFFPKVAKNMLCTRFFVGVSEKSFYSCIFKTLLLLSTLILFALGHATISLFFDDKSWTGACKIGFMQVNLIL